MIAAWIVVSVIVIFTEYLYRKHSDQRAGGSNTSWFQVISNPFTHASSNKL